MLERTHIPMLVLGRLIPNCWPNMLEQRGRLGAGWRSARFGLSSLRGGGERGPETREQGVGRPSNGPRPVSQFFRKKPETFRRKWKKFQEEI